MGVAQLHAQVVERVIELILELVVQLLFEVILPGLPELLFEASHGSRRPTKRPWLARLEIRGIGSALAWGAIAGAIATLLLRSRLFPSLPITGASLVLSPLVCGLIMHEYGTWARSRRRRVTFLASARGGASFALGFAATRLVLFLSGVV